MWRQVKKQVLTRDSCLENTISWLIITSKSSIITGPGIGRITNGAILVSMRRSMVRVPWLSVDEDALSRQGTVT